MHQLKFGYQTLCWLSYPDKRYTVEEVVRDVKAAGFKGIEFAEQLQHFERVPDFAGFMKSEGMTMASLSCGISYEKGDSAEETRKRAEFGSRFGIDALMLCGGWGPEASEKQEKHYDNLAENIDRLAEYTAQWGIKPSFHPHLDTLVENWEDTERLLSKSKGASLCLDIAHFAVAGSDPIAFFKKYRDRMAMVHLKDWIDDPSCEICGRKGRFCELGEGRVDVEGFLEAAREAEYDGWLVIELDNTTRTPLESAQISYNFLKSKGFV